jgi:outer membrane protein, multidrug efflux system
MISHDELGTAGRSHGRAGVLAGALALLLASGCARVPRAPLRAPDVPAAPAWSAAAAPEGPIVEDWIRSFGDPRLDALVHEALATNHDLAAAAARLSAASAEARIAGADRLPSVSARASGARRRQTFIGLPVPGGDGGVLSSTSSSVGVSLDLSWEADLWGRLRAGQAAAWAELEAVEAELHGARLSLAAQTAKAWFAAAESEAQLDLALRALESYRSTLERVRARFERGLTGSLDVHLAEANVATAQALLEARREQSGRLRRQLELLLGRYPAAALQAPRDLPELPPAVPAGLPAEVLDRRPDLRAARLRVLAADARIVQARAALYPRLSLTASGGTASEALLDLLDGDFGVWSLVANLLQPVFQGGRLRAGVDVARSRSLQALEAHASAVLRAFGEVETALEAETLLARREAALSVAAEHSETAAGLAEERYSSGLADLLTVLEAQRRALAAQSELHGVRRARLETRVNLHLALGGGFDARPRKKEQPA